MNLLDQIDRALSDRETWEQKQRIFYEMRHEGLRRRNLPHPGAADLHYPLIDSTVEKLKPFYYNQIFASELLADFVALKPQHQDATLAAAEYFDFRLKQDTNFEQEVLSEIDSMLNSGRGVLKLGWDPYKQRMFFEQVDPLLVIVPQGANELEDADWFVHVRTMSVAAYQRDRRYRQDPEILERIKGGQNEDDGDKDDEKKRREGLNFTEDENQILLWEVYEQGMGSWVVRTVVPQARHLEVRRPFRLRFTYQGRPFVPFVSFPLEIKDRGWYAPRGIAERLAPFETSLCKLWNEKHDAMSLFNRPLFVTDGRAGGDQKNIRVRPGEILPPGISPVAMPRPPVSFDEELQNTRLVAEQSLMVPDVGLGNALDGRDNRTATEVNLIGSLSNQGIDMRGRIFRQRMGELYMKAWAIMLLYQKEELIYYTSTSRRVLPQQAFVDAYQIRPSGSPDQWNRALRQQRALQRFQLLQGHPNADQEGLVRDLLQEDDPRLLHRVFRPTGVKEADQGERQAYELILLMQGYPVTVKPDDDDMIHIQVIYGKLEQLGAKGDPVDEQARNLIQGHMVAHLEALKAKNPQAANQIVKELQSAMEAAAPQAQIDQAGPAPMPQPMAVS